MNSNSHILITGASGLLGAHLLKVLLEKGHKNIIVLLRDLKDPVYADFIYQDAIIVIGDITNSQLMNRIFSKYKIDTVYHLAAQSLVEVGYKNPTLTFETNILGTWNLMEAIRNYGQVSKVLIASSDKAYGDLKKEKYQEHDPLRAIYPYDISKACSEMIAQCYFKTYGIPTIIVRCGNLFGEGDTHFSRIVPGTIRSILKHENPFIRSDGTYIRDYIYAEDAALAYLFLSENGQIGESYNVSYGFRISVIDMVKLILKKMDSFLDPIIENRAKNEIKEQCLDPSKIQALAYIPKWGFHKGLEKTIRWYQELHQANVLY